MNNRLSKRFLYLQKFFQLIGIINPINVDVVDLGKTLRLSYFENSKILDRKQSGIDISVSSEVLRSMFKYEYGANTVAVNPRRQVYAARPLSKMLWRKFIAKIFFISFLFINKKN